MGIRTSTVISWLMHPLWMPVFVMILLLNGGGSLSVMITPKLNLLLTGMIVVTTVLIPMMLIFLIYKLGIISSIYMRTREERLFPLLILAIFYYVTYYFLRSVPIPLIYHMYMLGATLLLVILMTLNFFRKISLHAAGTGAFTGLVTGIAFNTGQNFTLYILAGLLLSGLTASARAKLNAHQPSDLYIGWVTGAIVMFFTGFLF